MRIDKTDLGEVIKTARLNKGLTQETLAEKVGVGARHIMAIENEGSNPSYEVLYMIIRVFNISPDLIFYPEKTADDKDVEDISHILYHCDERSRKIIRATAQAALDSQPME